MINRMLNALNTDSLLGSSGGGGLLPAKSGAKADNGVKLNTVNKSVLLTILWCIMSLYCMWWGFSHCRQNSYYYKFTCDKDKCEHLQQSYGFSNVRELPRSGIASADQVRIDPTGAVLSSKNRVPGRNGYSVRVVYNENRDEKTVGKHVLGVGEEVLISLKDMRRKYAKTSVTQLQKYIIEQSDTVSIKNASNVTVLGVLTIFIGFISLMFACLLGAWADPKRRKIVSRKAS